jgi:hypothetical protein
MALRAAACHFGAPPSQSEGMLGPSPEDIAAFLAKTEGLDKTTIGDYLGEREDMALKVGGARFGAAQLQGVGGAGTGIPASGGRPGSKRWGDWRGCSCS